MCLFKVYNLAEKVKQTFGWTLQVILRTDSCKGFQVLPKRWIVERTFTWFESYRRFSKIYEFNTDTSVSNDKIDA